MIIRLTDGTFWYRETRGGPDVQIILAKVESGSRDHTTWLLTLADGTITRDDTTGPGWDTELKALRPSRATPYVGDGQSADAALAIGEDAFNAGWKAALNAAANYADE